VTSKPEVSAKPPVTLPSTNTQEGKRLAQAMGNSLGWRRWGPYVSERSWGTVREDYSASGNAWDYLSHDLARSKAYRWGEDGLAGICDRYQLLVFALAFWNGKDPILKERAFGLTPAEGNHGEDVKEYYFYLDSTPTHSYMRYLYKYPQDRYPYELLVERNRKLAGRGFEYELLDTGVFEHDRYFDIFVEYAKASEEDICIRIEAHNRGPEAAPLHIIPTLWFRNTWSWGQNRGSEPRIALVSSSHEGACVVADDSSAESPSNLLFDYKLGKRFLYGPGGARVLFTDNETNTERLYNYPNERRFLKDAFHKMVVDGEVDAVNPQNYGTKCCLDYERLIPAGSSAAIDLRFTPEPQTALLAAVSSVISSRRKEADEFYSAIHPPKATDDEKSVQRQAFAGMLWSKQIYLFDVDLWLEGDDPSFPPPSSRKRIRNVHWRHLNSMRVLSMPDKWEYPWFAAWDLAFHTVAFALVDLEFAKEQLWLMLFEQFQHPNGQIPAYEWEFSDLNPPVHAWAIWRVYMMERSRTGVADRPWLEKCFHKLLINFAWWVNKVDSTGNNVFEGGFLGLDNITVIDRSDKLPGGAVLEQSDGTGWMGLFCLHLMRIALELAAENRAYESLATKFFEHFIYIGSAMNRMGGTNYSLWNEEDGFFYDVLRYADGSFHDFRVRSMVGIVPLFAVDSLREETLDRYKEFNSSVQWFLRNRKDLTDRCCHYVQQSRRLGLTIAAEDQIKYILRRIFDQDEFLSDYGIRSLSKYHEKRPFVFGTAEVRYEPAESENKIKGGNSNWRGPIWFPNSFLVVESLRKLAEVYEDKLTSQDEQQQVSLREMAREIANRMISIFTRNQAGLRPVYGGLEKFQKDPYWRDFVLFHEYFHGDNGAGIGASHQTGWTGLVACLIDEWRR
jgi:hypothetical protein